MLRSNDATGGRFTDGSPANTVDQTEAEFKNCL
jgi:hypothetical protein